MGIQNIWKKDEKNISRDLKKRGKKMDLQHLNTPGTNLVGSQKYVHLRKFFHSNIPNSQCRLPRGMWESSIVLQNTK